jgi:GNAT superfamily N-acetyltransferase
MNSISLTHVDALAPADAVAIVHRLTKSGSEFQREVSLAADGASSSATPIALWHDGNCLMGWACSHVWRGSQTLEMFVDERHRKTGIATALSMFLRAAGIIEPAHALAVFSPHTHRIATRCGFCEVWLYERAGEDWQPASP